MKALIFWTGTCRCLTRSLKWSWKTEKKQNWKIRKDWSNFAVENSKLDEVKFWPFLWPWIMWYIYLWRIELVGERKNITILSRLKFSISTTSVIYLSLIQWKSHKYILQRGWWCFDFWGYVSLNQVSHKKSLRCNFQYILNTIWLLNWKQILQRNYQ